jgi:light-regulated signal transduction histidine kinase (bacteriophytochrome)/ActR/RegA family two-component response regulator
MTHTANYAQAETTLTNCDKEPIHRLGKIQKTGFLIALASDWNCIACSQNISEFLQSESPENLIGQPFAPKVEINTLQNIRNRISQTLLQDEVIRFFNNRFFKDSSKMFDIALHYSDEVLIIECEEAKSFDFESFLPQIRKNLLAINASDTLHDYLQSAAQAVFNIVPFDRVMVYKFHPDGTGEVVAEVCQPNIESFYGLRYPSSDIPKQARQLYLRNVTRIICNVHDEGVDILPKNIQEQFDLSMSCLRSVSPIHLEYLKNMGVEASFSISIIVDGNLWGLFACHHYEPMNISMGQRAQCELFADTFSLELSSRIRQNQIADTNLAKSLHLKMMTSLNSSESLFDNIQRHISNFSAMIPADSTIIIVDNQFAVSGQKILDEDRIILMNYLNRSPSNEVIYTDHLLPLFDRDLTLHERFSGFLAIPISRRPRDYIIFLRKEETQNVTWAGNPEKPIEFGPNGSRLSPRKSFAAWKETRRNYSKPWTLKEKDIANQIRTVMLEVMIRTIDERERQNQDAQKRQDILIHELNHRVRNILGLISSIVTQTSIDNKDVEKFRDILNGRIQALAIAQKTLTHKNWEAQPLFELINISLKAYNNEQFNIVIEGTDVLLPPKTYTTLTLVIHELTTNAVKYGALKDANRLLKITSELSDSGNLLMKWVERGIVIPEWPRRRGFGSVIIERSIPFDLNGEVNLNFSKDELCVAMLIPASVIQVRAKDAREHVPVPDLPVSDDVLSSKMQMMITKANALILEDNLVMALEIENDLKNLGFQHIKMAASAHEAEALMQETVFDFAVLDINLGDHTSYSVAEQLNNDRIPFIFVTGYSDIEMNNIKFDVDTPLLIKPIQLEEFNPAVLEIFKKRAGEKL